MTPVSKHATPAAPCTPVQAAELPAVLDEHLDPDLFRALSDPTRARLLSCLVKCGRACSVTEVAACCAVDFSVVARHLALLARVGILESRKEGRTVWYALRGDALCARLRDLADAIEEWRRDPGCDCGPGGCDASRRGART